MGSEIERLAWRRWRWRARGAAQWPLFALFVVGDVLILHLLPVGGGDYGLIEAFVASGALNLTIVAVLGPLAGVLLQRLRPDLPRVIASDYAASSLIVGLGLLLLALGVLST